MPVAPNVQQVATRSKGAPVSIGKSSPSGSSAPGASKRSDPNGLDRLTPAGGASCGRPEPVSGWGGLLGDPEAVPQPGAVPAPDPDDRPTIGGVLAQARLAAGLSVDQVSAQTRVRVPIVHAIEAGDFSRCGGDFYARGHIRALAHVVGADAENLVARYDAEYSRPVAARPAQIFETDRFRSDRQRPNWTMAMVAAIVVVLLFVAVNLVSGKSSDEGRVASEPLPSVSRTASSAPASRPVPVPSRTAIAAVPADRVTVKLTATEGRSWVSATGSDGKVLYQKVLRDGESKTLTDSRKLKLILGNPAVVHLFVNGKDLGVAGTSGEVARLTYTRGDPQAG